MNPVFTVFSAFLRLSLGSHIRLCNCCTVLPEADLRLIFKINQDPTHRHLLRIRPRIESGVNFTYSAVRITHLPTNRGCSVSDPAFSDSEHEVCITDALRARASTRWAGASRKTRLGHQSALFQVVMARIRESPAFITSHGQRNRPPRWHRHFPMALLAALP